MERKRLSMYAWIKGTRLNFKEEFWLFTTTWMNLEDIIPSEVSQTQINTASFH